MLSSQGLKPWAGSSRAGFKIQQESFIGNKLCIEARKTGDPVPMNGRMYGPLDCPAKNRTGRKTN